MFAIGIILVAFIGWGVYTLFYQPTRGRLVAFASVCMALACISCIGALSDHDPSSLGLVVVFSVLFLASVVRSAIHEASHPTGKLICPKCRYDLRGHLPEKCPECGGSLTGD